MGNCLGNHQSVITSHDDYDPKILENCLQTPLVSLEEAVRSLTSTVPLIDSYVRLAKSRCDNPADGLTCDQSASIMLCTMRWQPNDQCLSVVLNETLRSENPKHLQVWFPFLKLLFTALAQLPTMQSRIYRGIRTKVSKDYSVNKLIIWRDFALCTNSLESLKSEINSHQTASRTIFTIHNFTGKDISKHAFYPSMNLILILPGTHFQVTQISKDRNKTDWIDLKEIQVPLMMNSLSCHNNVTKNVSWTKNPCHSLSQQARQYSWKESIDRQPLNSAIHIRGEPLSRDDIQYLVEKGIREKNCTELWMNNVKLNSASVLVLSQVLFDNRTLKKLYLNDNFIHDRGVYYLARALTTNHCHLKELYLARNGITSIGSEYLATMLLTNQSLTHLSLYGNEIDDTGMRSLMYALTYYNKTLEYVYMSGNRQITDASVDALLELFQHNKILKKLHLFNCSFSERGREKLRQNLQQQSSFHLFI